MAINITEQDNFRYLTFALILLLLGMASAEQFFDAGAQRLVQSSTVVVLLIAVWGAREKNYIFKRAFIFPIAIIANVSLSNYLDILHLQHTHLFLLLIFFTITAFKTAKQVLFTGEIDGNKILGAICLYILIGLIWGVIYTLMQIFFPPSFTGIPDSKNWFELLPDFVYFSFVSITTLGFGDISPTLPIPKFMVYLEAIIGQFYMAILVASLVGARMSSIEKENKKLKK